MKSIILTVCLLAVSVASAQYIEATIDLGPGYNPASICYNSTNNKVYTADFSSDGVVTVIDGQSHQVIRAIPVGQRPYALVYNVLVNKVYGQVGGDAQTFVLDGESDSVLATLAAGYRDGFTFVHPPGRKLFLTSPRQNLITSICTRGDTVLAEVEADGAYDYCWATAQNKLYFTGYTEGNLYAVDPERDSLLSEYHYHFTYPRRTEYNSREDKVYVVDESYLEVWVVDPATDSIVSTVSFQNEVDYGVDIAYVSDRNLLFVTQDHGAGSVLVIDGAADTALATIPVDSIPYKLHYDPDRGRLYCFSVKSGRTSVVDVRTLEVLATLPVDEGPYWTAWDRVNGRTYVACCSTGTITVIRDSTPPAIAEQEPVEVERRAGPTVMRASDLARIEGRVLDVQGREVRSATSDFGNRTSHLPPGVYFVCPEGPRGQGFKGSSVRKVILTR